jgi:phage FluMu protein gp41
MESTNFKKPKKLAIYKQMGLFDKGKVEEIGKISGHYSMQNVKSLNSKDYNQKKTMD